MAASASTFWKEVEVFLSGGFPPRATAYRETGSHVGKSFVNTWVFTVPEHSSMIPAGGRRRGAFPHVCDGGDAPRRNPTQSWQKPRFSISPLSPPTPIRGPCVQVQDRIEGRFFAASDRVLHRDSVSPAPISNQVRTLTRARYDSDSLHGHHARTAIQNSPRRLRRRAAISAIPPAYTLHDEFPDTRRATPQTQQKPRSFQAGGDGTHTPACR